MFKSVLVAGLLSVMATSTAQAGAVLYECTVTEKKEGLDWISDKVGIVIHPNKTATVSDAVILHFLRQPLTTNEVRQSAKRLDVRWTVRGARDSAQKRIDFFDYNARIDTKTGAFAIYAKPDGFRNRFSGKGICVMRTAG